MGRATSSADEVPDRAAVPAPLLHVGFHKTGSTWLQERLFNGSACTNLASRDEIQLWYFDVDPFDFDAEALRALLTDRARAARGVPVLSFERFSGSPHAGGHDARSTADRLAATLPDARVLIVIRRQVDLIVSCYKQFVDVGGGVSFRRYVQPVAWRPDLPIFRFEQFEFDRFIGYYRNLFGDVLVLPYELLAADADEFLRRVAVFAGAEVPDVDRRPFRTSRSAAAVAVERIGNRYLIRHPLNPTGMTADRRMHEFLKRRARELDDALPYRVRNWSNRRLTELAAAIIGDRYKESNARTAELTGLPLGDYGYDM
jgi:hypothetical protein